MVGAHANFLVGVERHADLTMFNLLVLLQIHHSLHDFSDAGLVVGTQQCRAVGYDEVLTDVLQQLGELLRARHNAF